MSAIGMSSSVAYRTSVVENEEGASGDGPHVLDAGNFPEEHYKERMSPLRFRSRKFFLPFIIKETELLGRLQRKLRRPLLDIYFSWTASLASHTFYATALPITAWLGCTTFTRDLCFILGAGVYLSGFVKDYLCFPRPLSPPLYRITMSSYTTQEYGLPSSHSANATSVTLLCMFALFDVGNELSLTWLITIGFSLTVYYFSLVFGRIYCGMHGFTDIAVGAIIGIALFIFRRSFGEEWDALLFSIGLDSGPSCLRLLSFISFYLSLIYFHCEPIDGCPCIDDSISFIGVLMGLDISDWLSYYFDDGTSEIPTKIPYSYHELGLSKTLLRLFFGVVSVALWKTFSKPVIKKSLEFFSKAFVPPLLVSENLRDGGASANFEQIVQTLSYNDATNRSKNSVGVNSKNNAERNVASLGFRLNIDVVTRIIVYVGIPLISLSGFSTMARWLHVY